MAKGTRVLVQFAETVGATPANLKPTKTVLRTAFHLEILDGSCQFHEGFSSKVDPL